MYNESSSGYVAPYLQIVKVPNDGASAGVTVTGQIICIEVLADGKIDSIEGSGINLPAEGVDVLARTSIKTPVATKIVLQSGIYVIYSLTTVTVTK